LLTILACRTGVGGQQRQFFLSVLLNVLLITVEYILLYFFQVGSIDGDNAEFGPCIGGSSLTAD